MTHNMSGSGGTSTASTTYRGFATMYMRMPMSSSTLPIQGTCIVEDRRITLKFPFTGIEFDLPGQPRENRNDYDFTIRSQRGDMTMTIGYIGELRAFTGTGRMDPGSGGGVPLDDEAPVLTFCFYGTDSPLTRLPRF
jgi:hypothetical protein